MPTQDEITKAALASVADLVVALDEVIGRMTRTRNRLVELLERTVDNNANR